MARLPKGSPRTVDDPDAQDYARMIARQRTRNGLIEMGPEPSRRRPGKGEIDSRAVVDTAGLAGNLSTAAQLIPEAAHQLRLDPDALKGAYKAVKNTNRWLGPVATGVQDLAQYHADRAQGMPVDEAAIKNGGGLVLGTGLGGFSAGATLPLGPGVATAVGWAGNEDGHMLAQGAAEGWAGMKRFGRQVARTTSEGLARLGASPPWFQDRVDRR